jgi:ribosome maturation factor RimP
MSIAHIKVTGLDEARLVALVEPVLLARSLNGVELLWKTDSAGWVLVVNVERVDAKLPGEGVTVDLCSDISHDLARVLDESNLIPNGYRLEVGSPGLERALYSIEDFQRFAGWAAKVKLSQPLGDQHTLRGKILEVNAAGEVTMETEKGNVVVAYDHIASAHLVVDWDNPSVLGGAKAKSPKPRSSERDRRNRASKRKR